MLAHLNRRCERRYDAGDLQLHLQSAGLFLIESEQRLCLIDLGLRG